ncbi:MAG: DsbE family thiol:disulfide interchange protein [Boseongicola sp.]|nr:DsbE family thiol:disulfide interchange protein [Boseongicola sp.]
MARKQVPWLALVPPVVFAALAGLFLGGMYRDDPDALPSTIVGQPAPTLALTPLPPKSEIAPEAMADGQIKIVNYWASWCAPCRIEHPQLMRLADEGLAVYGVNYKDDPEKAIAFLNELGDPYTGIGADRAGRTAIDWGVYGVPETFVVDGDGTVLLRFAGPITEVILEKRIRPAIGAASGSQ